MDWFEWYREAKRTGCNGTERRDGLVVLRTGCGVLKGDRAQTGVQTGECSDL